MFRVFKNLGQNLKNNSSSRLAISACHIGQEWASGSNASVILATISLFTFLKNNSSSRLAISACHIGQEWTSGSNAAVILGKNGQVVATQLSYGPEIYMNRNLYEPEPPEPDFI